MAPDICELGKTLPSVDTMAPGICELGKTFFFPSESVVHDNKPHPGIPITTHQNNSTDHKS